MKDIRSRCSSRSSPRAGSISSSIRDGNHLAVDDVPGRHRQDRPQDPRGEGLSVPEGMAVGLSTQASMVSPQLLRRRRQGVDATTRRTTRAYRLDVATGQCENFGKAKDPAGRQISAYGMPTDRNNNVYLLGFSGTTSACATPRRGLVQIWRDAVPSCRGRAAAGSTSRTGCGSPNTAATASACSIRRPRPSRNGSCRRRGARPMTWSSTKQGEVWTGSMLNDQVARLDHQDRRVRASICCRAPPTSAACLSMRPGPRPVFWVGSNHGASIVKLEPLD